MKTVLIFFRDADASWTGDCGEAVKTFLAAGFAVDSVQILSATDDIGFKHTLTHFKEVADNLIIFASERTKYNIKEIIAEQLDKILVENENARSFAEAVVNDNGSEYMADYGLLPIDATLVPNIRGCRQGFMAEDLRCTLVFLPDEKSEYKVMCQKYVIPYFEKKYKLDRKRLILKYFGDREKLVQVIERAREFADAKYSYDISVENGDYTVGLCFDHYTADNGQEIVRHIVEELKDDIYAEEDFSLAERLFDLLKLRQLKVATAESFTAGRIVSAIIANNGASSVVCEGIVCYQEESKMRLLGVESSTLMRNGAVSSAVAYQMAVGLLDSTDCDIAIATTGLAGPDSDKFGNPVGLCYIAIGMRDGVHTYKFNFSGDREKITEKAKNAALFLAIKKIRNYDKKL